MKKQLAFIVSSMLLAACSSTPKTNSDLSAAPANGAKTAAAPAATTAAAAKSNDSQALSSVYFDTDRSNVKPEFKAVVQHQVEWMKAHKADVVTVAGNTDERGSTEYNLALGHRRASSVHHMLVAMGIPAKRIKDVSFGEAKPKATCHEEQCWEQNRRVDFVHQQG